MMLTDRDGIAAKDVVGPALLEVEDLQVRFRLRQTVVRAVSGVTLSLREGRTLAIVGESGSGKSVTARAIMGLLPPERALISGSVRLLGEELIGLPDRQMSDHRGSDIALVPQDPSRSLNPTIRIGKQIVEAIRLHDSVSADGAKRRAIDLLERVRLPSAGQRFYEYPHQLSGGMRQRVVIAMALSCNPKILIADEATTALDVTTQAQIMDLLLDLQDEFKMGMILISHDLALAASYTDEVAVMYGGRVVEQAATERLFGAVRMPYTRALLDAVPTIDRSRGADLAIVGGRPPDPGEAFEGCAFAPRCARAERRCEQERPPLAELETDHWVACFYPLGASDATGIEDDDD